MKSLKKALQISTFYFIFGMLWIYISDDIAEVLSFGNLHQLTVLQNFKGWFFIIITTLLLFILSYYFFYKQFLEYTHYIDEQETIHRQLMQKDFLIQTIINSSPDAIFVKDLEGKYILFNVGAGNLVGMAPEKVIGQTDSLIFSSEAASELQIIDRSIAFDKNIINHEECLGVCRTPIIQS